MNDGFREGARSNDPGDRCPRCSETNLLLSMDFKRFGKHRLRACQHCKAVYVDGERACDLTLVPIENEAGS